MQRVKTYVFCLLSMAIASAPAAAQQFESGDTQATLIELYTSQGCSSCPPAEEYLNSLKDHPRLWKELIPIALHVDYWDYIGWKDHFASPKHTQRQRAYARVNAQRAIYTPAFFVNGRPWRRGFFGRDPDVSKHPAGILRVVLQDDQINASFSPDPSLATKTLLLNISIVGMGLKTRIEAGERTGDFSAHEFVSLHSVSVRSSNNQWRFRLPGTTKHKADQYALVAWISEQNDPRPLQAVGGYLR